MSILKKTAQAFAGLAAALAASLAVSSLLFPEERDTLAAVGGLRLGEAGIGAGLSLLTVLAFANGWIGAAGRRLSAEGGAGRLWNGIGFGLLPGIAVWKIFARRTVLAAGTRIPDGLGNGWFFGAGGRWLPMRMETVLAVILFAAFVLWLAARKREMPENGDLAGVALSLWSSVRLVTENFRAEQIGPASDFRMNGWLAAGIMLLVLTGWTVRAFRQKRNTGYAAACVPVFLASIAGIALIQNRVLKTGLPAADLAAQACLSLLALKAVLCMGRVTR